jgi:hypothetical protein
MGISQGMNMGMNANPMGFPLQQGFSMMDPQMMMMMGMDPRLMAMMVTLVFC